METKQTTPEADWRRIWWIASYPKSGSTWVRMVLNSYLTGFPPEINLPWQYATGDLQRELYQLTCALPLSEMDSVAQFYYRPAVLMNFVLASRTTDCALKTHHMRAELNGIPLIPPELTKAALYIVRDPRAVAVSLADHLGRSINYTIDLMAENQATIHRPEDGLCHLLGAWCSHVDSWTLSPPFRVTVVRYEDLIGNATETWAAALRGLGIPEVDPEKLATALERCSFQRLQEAEAAEGFREVGAGGQFFRRGTTDSWRETLTESQTKAIEAAHGESMRRWGYLDAIERQEKRPGILPRPRSYATATVRDRGAG